MKPSYLYRVQEQSYSAGIDEYGDPLPGGPTHANLHMIPVLKETPCGWWIPEDRFYSANIGPKRWVSKNRAIPYACLTVEEAVEAWHQRIAWRIRVMRRQIEKLEEARMRHQHYGFYQDQRRWCDPDKPDLMMELTLTELAGG